MSGIFAVYTPGKNCAETLLYGTDYLSHLGTSFGGMAVMGRTCTRRIHRISDSQFKTVFMPDLEIFRGNYGIGVISSRDKQPLEIVPINRDLGAFNLITIGVIENADDLIDEFMASGIGFDYEEDGSVNMTILAGMLISQSDSIHNGIEKMFYRIRGSISLILMNADGIIIARSLYGHSALFIGKRGDDVAVSVETTPFDNLGFLFDRMLKPSEIVQIDENGINTLSCEHHGRCQFCPFLLIYTAFPSARFTVGDATITPEKYRSKVGAFHAECDYKKGLDAQQVVGMADSGTPYAIGYACKNSELVITNRDAPERRIPYCRFLLKYTPGWGRSYTPPTQEARDRIANMKQVPVFDVWDDIKSIVMTEDSIVRGTQLRQYLSKLRYIIEISWSKVWPEVHLRIGCPPLAWPCKYMFSTRSTKELAARRAVENILGHEPNDDEMRRFIVFGSAEYLSMVEWLRKDIGAASLEYLPLEAMPKILGVDIKKICTYCWNGIGV